jgi:hypothetical protein
MFLSIHKTLTIKLKNGKRILITKKGIFMKSTVIIVNSLLIASVLGITTGNPIQAQETSVSLTQISSITIAKKPRFLQKPIPTPIETPHTTPSHDQGIKDNSMKGCGKCGVTGRTKAPEECANVDQDSVEPVKSENTSSSDAAKAGIPGIKAKCVRKQQQ